MKKKNIFISVGFIIYISLFILNKFVYELPDIIYVVIALTSFILIIIGIIKNKK